MTPLRERLPHHFTQNYASKTPHGQKSIRQQVLLATCELAQLHGEFDFFVYSTCKLHFAVLKGSVSLWRSVVG